MHNGYHNFLLIALRFSDINVSELYSLFQIGFKRNFYINALFFSILYIFNKVQQSKAIISLLTTSSPPSFTPPQAAWLICVLELSLVFLFCTSYTHPPLTSNAFAAKGPGKDSSVPWLTDVLKNCFLQHLVNITFTKIYFQNER